MVAATSVTMWQLVLMCLWISWQFEEALWSTT